MGAMNKGQRVRTQGNEATPAEEQPQSASRSNRVERSHLLAGLGGSPGQVRGRACVVSFAVDLLKVTPGCILVCADASTAWTIVFPWVAGMVADRGGSLCNAATVAREVGIPAVFGARCATSLIKDGDMLIVDGTEGLVEVRRE